MHRALSAVLFSLAACAAVAASPAPAESTAARGSITFADRAAERCFDAYEAFLQSDPTKFADEIATVRQLVRSEVEYRIVAGEAPRGSASGLLTTDGERVVVHVSHCGGAPGEAASINSLFAHELEHARQFDSGEFALARNPRTGEWVPVLSSYDIGDEVKAWTAQLRASVPMDFWRKPSGSSIPAPTSLSRFANARTDAERVDVLLRCGYADLGRRAGRNVVFPPRAGYGPRHLVRPSDGGNYFARVYRVTSGRGW